MALSLELFVVVIVCIFISLCNSQHPTPHPKRPHIVFLVADDLGWADVSYHGSDIPTPHIDALANRGIKLTNYYVQYLCTPTRAAILTGRYPIRYGLQHLVIIPAEPAGINETEVILPQYLKKAGYVTRAVGKWHVGFAKWAYTPTYRGFDSFFGYYNAEEDHYLHTISATTSSGPVGYDLRRNTQTDWSGNGTYGTYLFNNEVVSIIKNHNPVNPLFLYYTFQVNHTPLQVPDRFLPFCAHETNQTRKTLCAMGVAMDEAVANVTRALQEANMWDDTLLIFTTDNGGMPDDGGNNWPLRGGKFTLWEGGVRGTAFIHGKMLPRKGVSSNALMHCTDWLPTLAKLAGSPLTSPYPLDGKDVWAAITTGSPSPRTEILLNIDPIWATSAIRVGNWKLVNGTQAYDGYYPIQNSSVYVIPPPPYKGHALFDIQADPLEQHDLSDHYPGVVSQLFAKIHEYSLAAVPPFPITVDPNSFPSNFNGTWTPWL